MGYICGILGRRDTSCVRIMARAMKHRNSAVHLAEGEAFTVAAAHPLASPVTALVDGAPRNTQRDSLEPDDFARMCKEPFETWDLQGPVAAAVPLDDGRRWLLVRDRLGRRPLYYYLSEDFLLFASELKALLASGLVERRLNPCSVDRYLTFRCVPGGESIIEGVKRVEPGGVLSYRDGTLTESRFGEFNLEEREERRESAAEVVRDLLAEALDREEPRVLLWSAGIDSAALGALRPSLQPVFVTLSRAWQDEAWQAKESARRMGLRLRVKAGRRLTESSFRRAIYHLDEPIGDAGVFPLWLLCQAAGEEAQGLVSGHGADELMGGYPRYHFLQRAQKGARSLVPVNILAGLLPSLPPNAFLRRGGRYLSVIRDNFETYLSLLSVFDREERNTLYSPAMRAALRERVDPMAIFSPHFTKGALTRNLLSLDLHFWMPDLLLTKIDRMAAAHGVSVAFPYLDDQLSDYVVALSPHTKFGIRSKPLLRLAMKGLVPGLIRQRTRRDFRVPQSGRVYQTIERVARQTVTAERADAIGLFNWQAVEEILRCASHNIYRRRQFWALLMFFAWYREMMES